jgi:signal transduction histidine kinase
MKFSTFIKSNLDAIVGEWETFARTLLPSGNALSGPALRDHARAMLVAIADDMESGQTVADRSAKSRHIDADVGEADSAASSHGALRQLEGLDISQLFGEFRSLRASVLAMWRRTEPAIDTSLAIEEIARFNEGIDQAVAESVDRYAKNVATFMAVIGRDLRSPLWAIKGSSEMLSKGEVSNEVRREVLDRITRSSEAMGHVIRDLTEFSETHLGRSIPVRLGACDLRKVSDEALETVRSIYPRQDFAFTFSGELVLKADALRMQQVVVNLLTNAAHHSDRRSAVALKVEGSLTSVCIKVTNQGRRIPDIVLKSIFEPTVTVPAADAAAHQDPYTGLGLGLFIVREIVSRHKGSITVESNPDSGTTFAVVLPR